MNNEKDIFDSPVVSIVVDSEGEPHCEVAPAVVSPHGEAWYSHGELHRLGGPAVTHKNGLTQWWVRGYLHRHGGPAITYSDGGTEWWWEGIPHRLDGPAFVGANGDVEWWLQGYRYPSEEEWRAALEVLSSEDPNERLLPPEAYQNS